MALSALAVARHSVLEEEALRLLAEPRSHPQIPGEVAVIENATLWRGRFASACVTSQCTALVMLQSCSPTEPLAVLHEAFLLTGR
jgi:hypothetical protein